MQLAKQLLLLDGCKLRLAGWKLLPLSNQFEQVLNPHLLLDMRLRIPLLGVSLFCCLTYVSEGGGRARKRASIARVRSRPAWIFVFTAEVDSSLAKR